MLIDLNKKLKIIYLFGKINLMKQTAHKSSFILAFIGKSARMVILIIFWQAIFSHVPQIGDWDKQSIFYFILIYLTIENVIVITFHRNLFYYFPDLLRKGDYDFVLVKPLNPLFYSSFQTIDFMDMISSLTVIILWLVILSLYPVYITWYQFIIFILLLILSYLFMAALSIIFASFSFYTITATGLGRFFEGIFRIARYPVNIYNGFITFLLSFIIPIGIITTLPAQTLLNTFDLPYIFYAIMFTIILFYLSIKIWNFSLKRYSSASS